MQPKTIQVVKTSDLPPMVVPHRVMNRLALKLAARSGKTLTKLVMVGIKHRKRLAPVYAAAGLNTIGTALSVSSNAPATAGTISVAGAIALAWWIRRRATCKRALRRNELVWVLVNSGAAAALLMTMALTSPLTPPVPGLSILWFLSVAGPYWWKRRIRPTQPLEVVDVDDRIRRWNERVACTSGALPDSALSAPEGDRNWKALLQLPSGKLTVNEARSSAVMGRIASAYGVPISSVVIEEADDGAADKAQLAIYQDNPLQDINYWTGPDAFNPATGVANIAIYPDGTPVGYIFFKPKSGVVHTLISGSSDAGKSRLLDLLLATERHAGGLIVSWVGDPQNGQSLPDWQDNVDYFGDSQQEAVLRLLVARDVMYARNERYAKVVWVDEKGRSRKGRGFFTPGLVADGEDPILSVTIDEAHDVLKHPLAAEAAEDIALMGRKCGVKLRLVTQMPLLSQLGNSSPLRDSVAAGNVICLRTSSGLSGQVAFQSAFEVAPHKLPRTWKGQADPAKKYTYGLGYALGAESRSSIMRTSLIDDVYEWATRGETWRLGPEDEAIAKLSYFKWEAVVKGGAKTAQEVVEYAVTGGPREAVARAAAGTYKQAILDHLRALGSGEYAYTGAIAEAVNAPLQTTSTTLSRLEAEGAVTKLARGKWAAVNQPAAVAA